MTRDRKVKIFTKKKFEKLFFIYGHLGFEENGSIADFRRFFNILKNAEFTDFSLKFDLI